MLIRWPKAWPAEESRGTVLPQLVELRDLLPTLLDAAGAAIPDVLRARRGGSPCPPESSLDGMSMLRLIRGDASGWRDCIDLEHDICYAPENHWNALTDGKWKYIYHAFDGREQLFDMENDPGEMVNLAVSSEHADVLNAYRRMLQDWAAETKDDFPRIAPA